jgi:hypothetical protein
MESKGEREAIVVLNTRNGLLTAKIISYIQGTGAIDEERTFENLRQVNIKGLIRISAGVKEKNVEIIVNDYKGVNVKENVLNIL